MNKEAPNKLHLPEQELNWLKRWKNSGELPTKQIIGKANDWIYGGSIDLVGWGYFFQETSLGGTGFFMENAVPKTLICRMQVLFCGIRLWIL